VNVVTKRRLEAFWTLHPTAKAPLTAWHQIARMAEWRGPQDIKDQFRSADFVADNRVIFNIGGGNYRLVVRVSYRFKQVLVKFVGTHGDYDDIDPATV
jgi:mRNA interferase HigB